MIIIIISVMLASYCRRRIVLLLFLFLLSSSYICSSEKSSSKLSGKKSLTKTRILSEWKDILRDKLSLKHRFNQSSSMDDCEVRLSPIENDFLQWHFSFNGVADSTYDGGCYHGKIILSPDYPRKAPAICVMTPNGRWEVGKEICLSASSYHQETWDMKWNLRSLVMALRGHMLTQPKEIGSIVTTPDRQRFLAAMSRHYTCRQCGAIHSQLLGDDPITHADDSLHIDMMNNKLVNSKLRSRRLKKKIKSDSNSDRSTGQNIEKVRNKKLSLVFATKGVVLLLLSALLFFYQLNYV